MARECNRAASDRYYQDGTRRTLEDLSRRAERLHALAAAMTHHHHVGSGVARDLEGCARHVNVATRDLEAADTGHPTPQCQCLASHASGAVRSGLRTPCLS